MASSNQHFHLGLHNSPSGQQQQSGHSSHNSDTSPSSMSPKGHKHYQSHSHIDTPQPVLESSRSKTSDDSAATSGSYMDVQKHNHGHGLHRLVEQLPNPVAITSHTIQDHITELHYGHIARTAKKEARRSSQSTHPWKQGVSLTKSDSVPEYVEEVEDWKERDAELWAKELQKREKARTMTGSTS